MAATATNGNQARSSASTTGAVLLSTNPNSCKPDKYDGPAAPQVLEFRGDALAAATTAPASAPAGGPKTLVPKWSRDLAFHAHTYRSFAADGAGARWSYSTT